MALGPAGTAPQGLLRAEGPGGQGCVWRVPTRRVGGGRAVEPGGWASVAGVSRGRRRRVAPRGAWPALSALPCQLCPSRGAGGVPAAVGGDPGAAAAAEPRLPAENGICSGAPPHLNVAFCRRGWGVRRGQRRKTGLVLPRGPVTVVPWSWVLWSRISPCPLLLSPDGTGPPRALRPALRVPPGVPRSHREVVSGVCRGHCGFSESRDLLLALNLGRGVRCDGKQVLRESHCGAGSRTLA